MKRCKYCNKPLPIPTNPKTRNYAYCNKTCRGKLYYQRRGGAEAQREYYYQKNGGEAEDTIQCLICGKWYRQVGSHIWLTHKMTAREYREEMELEVKRGLTKGSYRELKGEQVMENGTVKNLESGAVYRFKPGDKVPQYKRSRETLDKLARARAIAQERRERANQ